MAVTVYDANARGESPDGHGYQDGTKIQVSDGHLAVLSSSRTIAVFAPGQWTRAEVTN